MLSFRQVSFIFGHPGIVSAHYSIPSDRCSRGDSRFLRSRFTSRICVHVSSRENGKRNDCISRVQNILTVLLAKMSFLTRSTKAHTYLGGEKCEVMCGCERASGHILYNQRPYKPHACGLRPEGSRLKIEREKVAQHLVPRWCVFLSGGPTGCPLFEAFLQQCSPANALKVNKQMFYFHLKWKVWPCFGGIKCTEFHHNTPPAHSHNDCVLSCC